MSRPLRIQYPGAVYHLMNRGSAGRKVFLSRTDYREFLKTVSEAHDLSGRRSVCLLFNAKPSVSENSARESIQRDEACRWTLYTTIQPAP